MPIHQFVALNSVTPPAVPLWLNVANSAPSDISIHDDGASCANADSADAKKPTTIQTLVRIPDPSKTDHASKSISRRVEGSDAQDDWVRGWWRRGRRDGDRLQAR